MRDNVIQSERLQKTDAAFVWMLTVPHRTPYPSVDTWADTALLRYRPSVVAPVSFVRAGQTAWKFSVHRHTDMPLYEAVEFMSNDAETGYVILNKTMEAVESASDHLLPIIPALLHPELVLIERNDCELEQRDIRIVTLPLTNTEHMKSDQEPGLIEWMGEVFHWDSALISRLAALFREEAFFDLLLEAKTLCGERYAPSGNAEYASMSARDPASSHALSAVYNNERAAYDDKLQPSTDKSPGNRLLSGLRKLGEALFGFQDHEAIHEVTRELDLSSDRFKIAQLSEGLPGTPDEELGHHAYILTDEFIIGRDMGKSDFWIDSFSISRRHAVIRRRAGSYFIEDLGSKNGTTVDGIKISKRREQLLPEKCKISFADHVYYFRSA